MLITVTQLINLTCFRFYNNHIISPVYTKICVLSAYTCDEACSSFVQLLRVKSFGIVSTYMVAYFCYRARYGVQLEKSTFERRTADFLWMMIFSSYIIAGVCSSL